MKLAELLQDYFKKMGPTDGLICEYSMPSERVLSIKDEILKCDEFKNVKTFNVATTPNELVTVKFSPFVEFSEDVTIYSIMLSPPIYDPSGFDAPIKDGIVITPILYNPKNLYPQRKLNLFFSPEQLQDGNIMNDEDIINGILENVKKALTNPTEYMPPAKRAILIRYKKGSIKAKDIPEEFYSMYEDIHVIL